MSKPDKFYISGLIAFGVMAFIYASLYYVGDIPEKEWREYHKLSGKDLTMIVVNQFFYTEYKKGAKNKKKSDCGGMVDYVEKLYGAKNRLMTAWERGQELQKYGYRRRTLESVRERDIIVFHKIAGSGHVGIVVKVDKKEGKIYYVEQTKKTNGFNYNWVRHVKSHRVYGIFFVTPTYFYGESI